MSRVTVTVAVVGLGHNGQAWVRGYQESPLAEVVGLCDLWPERRQQAQATAPQARAYSSLAEMLEKERPQALSVHTPDHLHAEPFVQGLAAGCHVLVEKPMANSLADLDRMCEAARGSDRKTHVGQILRFNPLFAEIKRLCAEGVFGELFYMEADYIHRLLVQADPARINPHLGNLNWYLEHEIPIVGGGVHPFDLLRWYADSEVVEVCGYGNSIAFPQMKSSDCQVGLFRFASGACAKVTALYAPVCDMARFYNLALYGTKATFKDGRLVTGEEGAFETTDLSGLAPAGHPYEPQIEHFLRAILEDRPTLVDAFSGANSAAAVLTVARAIETGQKQQVPTYRRRVPS